MVAQRLYDELFALPRADLDEVVARLKDHLVLTPGTTDENAELDEATRRLLDERLADIERNPSDMMTRDEAYRYVTEHLRSRAR